MVDWLGVLVVELGGRPEAENHYALLIHDMLGDVQMGVMCRSLKNSQYICRDVQ